MDGENISDSSVEQLFASFIKEANTTVRTAMKKPFSALNPDSTLAFATVGVEENRGPNKRRSKPTQQKNW